MQPVRLQILGLQLSIACLLLGEASVLSQSVLPPSESTTCELVGDICLGPTSISVAKEACSRIYDKTCTKGEKTCTRAYRKNDQNAQVIRCAYELIVKLGNIPASQRCGPRAAEALILRQEISDLVLTTSLQVGGFLSEIDSETGKIRAVHDALADRRDSAVGHSTLGSAVGTGGGAVGSSLALVQKTATAGNWVGATFGGVGAIFGFLGWYQQRGPRACFPDIADAKCQVSAEDRCTHPADGKTPNACSPTMLFGLVFPEAPEAPMKAYASFHSDYDLPIEKYLDDYGRRKTLTDDWAEEARQVMDRKKKKTAGGAGDELGSSANYSLMSAEPYLFASNRKPRKVSIDDLSDRANKLADLRTLVARMSRDLSRLTETLGAELQCLPDE